MEFKVYQVLEYLLRCSLKFESQVCATAATEVIERTYWTIWYVLSTYRDRYLQLYLRYRNVAAALMRARGRTPDV
jgi:hypothetical protein